jgi:hypothetical protein
VRAPKIRRILVRREMRPDLVVIGSVIPQNAMQLRFVEHVIEAFVPNRSDEALDVAVLPSWRAWCRRVIADSHCPNAAGETSNANRLGRRAGASGSASPA